MAHKRPYSRIKFSSISWGLVVFALLLTGCGARAAAPAATLTTQPTKAAPLAALPSPTVLLPSPTLEMILETPTETLSPTPEPPTATPTVTPSPTPNYTATPQVPVGSFALTPGTTAGAIAGSIQHGQVVTYTIGAAQFQPITLIMDSPHSDVTLGVSEENGNVLLDPAFKQTAWQMVLPSTQLYTIKIIGGAATENYQLTVKLPLMVSFPSGATSMTLNGQTAYGIFYSYALNINSGQTLTASLNVPSSTAYLDIYGITTGTVLSTDAKVNTWTVTLPQTEAYVIEVVPASNQVVDFSLSVSLTSAPAGSSTGNGTVTFSPGTTAAVQQGTVQAGQVLTYTVAAFKNQPMILLVESPNTDVTLGVLNPDGSILLAPANKWSYWQWQLPSTGLYTIQVIGGKTTEKYTLTVKLPQLVYFAGEPKTVTLHGNTFPGYVVSYAFRLSGSLHMTVSLNDPSGEAIIDIFGIQTGSLLSFKEGATSWEGILPATQEYVVEVVPRHGASVSFSLTVSIP